MAYLKLSNISKVYGSGKDQTLAVQDFNLDVQQGEFISFLGPSGCGKTTTLRMVGGFEIPTTGSITLDSNDITNKAPNQRNVGMVFQSYALFPNMTVAGNIGFGLQVRKEKRDAIKQRVEEMLELIQLKQYGDRYPYQLSGGQQQRVALARALAIRPQVLLLDEPLSALDAKIRVDLRQEIRRIQQRLGITTIYVTHDQEEALSISDRIVVMSHGLMEQTGTPFDIYNYPTTDFVAKFVGQINLIRIDVVDMTKGLVKVGSQTITVGDKEKQLRSMKHLAIRPEEITAGHKEGNNNLHGKVYNVNYLGAIIRLGVDVDGVRVSIDVFNQRNMKIPKEGDVFEFNFPVEACWLL
ncbi:MAG TPA: spermidine/putrescine ABC transporter ATP-binding protein [Anaerolineae bacterium]|nr:spermidine/putrescine ABC transporter ATP-binding protein [Anaerolineae bacterium]